MVGPDCARDRVGTVTSSRSDTESQLLSRILVTWIEVTVVGLRGGVLGTSVGGPPGLIASLVTTLLSLGILFYNVNELIKRWVAHELRPDTGPG